MMVTPNYPPQRVLDLGCGVRHDSCGSARHALKLEELYRLARGPLTRRASGPMQH